MHNPVKSKFCLAAPYEEMRIGLCSFSGDLHIGETNAKKAISEGAEIIISRGGTARVIKKSCSIPVVEIHVSGYDLLRVICRNIQSGKKLAVIGYDNVVNGAKTIAHRSD